MTYWETVSLAGAFLLILVGIFGVPSIFLGLADADDAVLIAGVLMLLAGILGAPALLIASGVLA